MADGRHLRCELQRNSATFSPLFFLLLSGQKVNCFIHSYPEWWGYIHQVSTLVHLYVCLCGPVLVTTTHNIVTLSNWPHESRGQVKQCTYHLKERERYFCVRPCEWYSNVSLLCLRFRRRRIFMDIQKRRGWTYKWHYFAIESITSNVQVCPLYHKIILKGHREKLYWPLRGVICVHFLICSCSSSSWTKGKRQKSPKLMTMRTQVAGYPLSSCFFLFLLLWRLRRAVTYRVKRLQTGKR